LRRGELPWEHESCERAVASAKARARTDGSLAAGLPPEAAFAIEALLRPAVVADGSGVEAGEVGGLGGLDHEECLRSLQLAIGTDARRQGLEGVEGRWMDWERQGLRWTAAGAILDPSGEVLHSPGGGVGGGRR